MVYDPPEPFETERLWLRCPTLADEGAVFDYAGDPVVTRYMGWRTHGAADEARRYLERMIAEWDQGPGRCFAIEKREAPDRLIGMIHVHREAGAIGFGYILTRNSWGRGYASEALRALVDHALTQADVFRTQAICDVENPASARVMEKAGMRFEGILRRRIVHPNVSAEPRDVRLYARVR